MSSSHYGNSDNHFRSLWSSLIFTSPLKLFCLQIFSTFLFAPTQNIADHLFYCPRMNWLALAVLAWPLTRPLIGRFESVLQ